MKICLVDFETTGVDIATAIPLQIGALLLDETSPGTFKQVGELMYYIKSEKLDSIPDEIVELTGITHKMIQEKGVNPKEALQGLLNFSADATYFMAHNRAYDLGILSQMLIENFDRGEVSNHRIFKVENWLCSVDDILYTKKYRCKILSHLALDHGCKVDPSKAHGALYDCSLIMDMLNAGKYSIQNILSYKNEPWVYLKACVEYDDRQLAKDAGYSWEQIRGDDRREAKSWIKRVKQGQFDAEKALSLPFKRLVLK